MRTKDSGTYHVLVNLWLTLYTEISNLKRKGFQHIDLPTNHPPFLIPHCPATLPPPHSWPWLWLNTTWSSKPKNHLFYDNNSVPTKNSTLNEKRRKRKTQQNSKILSPSSSAFLFRATLCHLYKNSILIYTPRPLHQVNIPARIRGLRDLRFKSGTWFARNRLGSSPLWGASLSLGFFEFLVLGELVRVLAVTLNPPIPQSVFLLRL